MKYTRFEISRIKKIGFEGMLLQFLVVIPILAISIGYALSSFVIIPRVQKESSVLNKSTALAVFKINKVGTLYFLQAGLYSNKEKAAGVISGINQKGFNASLGLSKGMYRIVLGPSFDLKEVQSLKENLAGAGYTGIINKIDLQLLDKSGAQELKLISEYMNIASNLVIYQQEFLQKDTNGEMKLDERFKNSISKLQSEYDKLSTVNFPEVIKKELSDFNNYFTENYNSFVKNAEEENIRSSFECTSNELVLLLELYKIVSQNYSN